MFEEPACFFEIISCFSLYCDTSYTGTFIVHYSFTSEDTFKYFSSSSEDRSPHEKGHSKTLFTVIFLVSLLACWSQSAVVFSNSLHTVCFRERKQITMRESWQGRWNSHIPHLHVWLNEKSCIVLSLPALLWERWRWFLWALGLWGTK